MTRLPVLVAAVLALGGCNQHFGQPLADIGAEPSLPAVSSYLTLGQQYLRANEPVLAKAAFIRSLRIEGVSAEALTGAGLAAEQQGLLSEARKLFEHARDKAPNSVIVHNNLGAVLYRTGEFHAAKQAFQAAYALSSGTNRVAEHNLGLSELAIRRADDALLPTDYNPNALQRLGSGEYKVLGGSAPGAKQTGVADDATG